MAVVVLGMLIVPGGMRSLVSSGAALAQTTDSPPSEPANGGVSEFMEAAKLGALASGNVIAGPGQLVLPPHTPERSVIENLWRYVGDSGTYLQGEATLTVQTFAPCGAEFYLIGLNPDGSPRKRNMRLEGHASESLTVSAGTAAQYLGHSFADSEEPCRALWVLRQTPETRVTVRPARDGEEGK